MLNEQFSAYVSTSPHRCLSEWVAELSDSDFEALRASAAALERGEETSAADAALVFLTGVAVERGIALPLTASIDLDGLATLCGDGVACTITPAGHASGEFLRGHALH